MANQHMRFTKEALKSQDGKKVPLRLEPGGPIIGEATLKYNEATGDLDYDVEVTNPVIAELLEPQQLSAIFDRRVDASG